MVKNVFSFTLVFLSVSRCCINQNLEKNFCFPKKKTFLLKSQNTSILHLYILPKCTMPILKGIGLYQSRTAAECNFGLAGRLCTATPQCSMCENLARTIRVDILFLCTCRQTMLSSPCAQCRRQLGSCRQAAPTNGIMLLTPD